jgi:hypothetical protein
LVDAGIVKAHAVDEGLILRKSEEAGGFVSVLRFGSQGAHFEVSKTEAAEGVDGVGFLVESSGESNGIWESETSESHRLGFRFGCHRFEKPEIFSVSEPGHREVVGAFGLKEEEDGACGGVEKVKHV